MFVRGTRRLLDAERAAGVRHHVLLSVAGIDAIRYPYYQAKLRQEEAVAAGQVPYTVLRTTPFHEFVAAAVRRGRIGPFIVVPRLRTAPVAAAEVAHALADVAEGPPARRAPDLGGPRPEEFTDLARRWLRAHGVRGVVVPVTWPGSGGRAMRDGAQIPTEGLSARPADLRPVAGRAPVSPAISPVRAHPSAVHGVGRIRPQREETPMTKHTPTVLPHLDRDDLLTRAARVIPNGVSAGGRDVYRDVIVRAQGAYLWNADGRRYLDHLLSYGPIVVGHSDARINQAVAGAAAQVDLTWVGPQAGEVELAEKIVEVVPSAEKVVFLNTGTDALQHALHVARAATGRQQILKFHGHYHGWAGALGVGANFDVSPGQAPPPDAPNSGGAATAAGTDTHVVEWNDAEAVRAVFEAYGRNIAAVFAEPYLHSYTNAAPAPGFLELLRDLTERYGAVLVFDEVKTGFRDHLGGYQAVAGVTPDLTALGKAMGNGWTIAALCGRADLMDLLGTEVTMDGTYYANPYAIAAARRTIEVLERGGIAYMDRLGQRLREGLTKAIADTGVTANVTGIGSGWIVNWRADPPVTFRQAVDADFDRAEAFRLAMLDAGILLPPYVITDNRICVAFTDDDIDETVAAARRAFAAVA